MDKTWVSQEVNRVVEILEKLILEDVVCACGEGCPINMSVDFLKKYPDVAVKDLAGVIVAFEVATFKATTEVQEEPKKFVSASPLEVLEEDDDGEEGVLKPPTSF